MSEKIDEGPVLAQIESEIKDSDDYPALRDRLATLGLKMLAKILPEIIDQKISAQPQSNKGSLSRKFQKVDGVIDWRNSPEKIERQIRAFQPWPGTYTTIDNKRLIIHSAHLEKNQLVLDLVQLEGKNPVDFPSFLRGWRGEKPEWLDKVKIIDRFR
jgi:methionyl-tRNA formyltransferase